MRATLLASAALYLLAESVASAAAVGAAGGVRLPLRWQTGAAIDGDRSGDLRPQAIALIETLAAHDGVATAALIREPGFAFAIAVPDSIRVWRRGLDGSSSSCSGRVDVIPFEQYVKGVLPHEWIASWEPASLEAGAVAIRTYAAWWVNAGGKYDCADVDDTTASQVYRDEFLPKTDAAVDATSGLLVVADGELVFAEYSAENSDPTEFGVDEPLCAGRERFGHGRGTCQWGTQRWALTEQKSFDWIVTHYYPGSEILDVTPEPEPDPTGPDAGGAVEDEMLSGGCSATGTGTGTSAVMWLLSALLLLPLRARARSRCGHGSRAPTGLESLLRSAFAACVEQPRRGAARIASSSPPLLAPRLPASVRNCASRCGFQAGRRSSTGTARSALAACAIALTACATPVPSTATTETDGLGGDSRLRAQFVAAGKAHGVPPAILATIAYVETRLHPVADALDDEHGHGDAPDFDVWEVARALEVLAAGREPARLGDWRDVLTDLASPELADAVFDQMARGWRGRDPEGRFLVLTARTIDRGDAGEDIGTRALATTYPGAIWNPAYSGNYTAASRGGAQIDTIVIHTAQGSYSGTISWFKNSSANVSAHYVVRSSDGQVTQMVDDSDVAWHDACFNTNTIGIEHEGYVQSPSVWYTETMYMESARLTSWLADQYAVPKDRAHILGHGETPDCSDHTDPGSGWNWTHFMALVDQGGVPTLGASHVESSLPTTMFSGQESIVYVELRNESTIAWGVNETRVGTQMPQDRESPFFVEGNWLSPSRPTGADLSTYEPGEVGRFTFLMRAPEVAETTTFVEHFQLLQDGVGWFGPIVAITITVQPGAAPGSAPSGPAMRDEYDVGSTPGGCVVAAGGGQAGGGCAILLLGALVAGRLARRRARMR